MNKFLTSAAALVISLSGGVAIPLIAPPAAIALSDQEVAARIGRVPVFVILTKEQQPLLFTSRDKDGKEVNKTFPVFINQAQAQVALAELQKSNQPLGKDARIGSLLLPKALELILDFLKKTNDPKVTYEIIPDPKQRTKALELYKADKNIKPEQLKQLEAEAFVPIFYSESLSITMTNQQGQPVKDAKGNAIRRIPLFLEYEPLAAELEKLKKQDTNPKAGEYAITVTDLLTIINTLTAAQPGSNESLIELLPPVSSLPVLQELVKQLTPTTGTTPPRATTPTPPAAGTGTTPPRANNPAPTPRPAN